MEKIKLSIIVINWNSGSQLQSCIDSVKSSTFIDFDIIVIDNNSNDKSLEFLKNDKCVTVVKNTINKGFAFACNQGISFSKSKYILLLNPDVIIHKNTLGLSVNFMEEKDDVAIMGCKQFDENGIIHRSCATFPTVMGLIYDILGLSKLMPGFFKQAIHMTSWDHLDSRFVDHVIGSYYLFRADLIDKIGLFDTQFFVYYEDLDFSYRVNMNGYKVFYNANVEIFHKGGGTSDSIKAKRLFFSLYSRLIFVKKHFNFIEAAIVYTLTLFIEPLIRISYSLISHKSKIDEIIKGYKYLFKTIFFKTKKYLN